MGRLDLTTISESAAMKTTDTAREAFQQYLAFPRCQALM